MEGSNSAAGAALTVDLRSDTVTKPTPEMRRAMAEAEVGDDVYREDPTVLKLEKQVAELLGKEDALFFPSGTMANLASIMAHCWERGSSILVGDQSHIYLFEQGGAAQLAGVQHRTLSTKPDGTFDLNELSSKVCIRISPDIHQSWTGVVCLENTHNRCGGVVLPTDYVNEVCKIAHSHEVPVHMDGARIYNASVLLGEPISTLVKNCDSVSMCLSKGLGTPAGSLIAGSKEFIARTLRCRKVLGGAMRQVGVLAAAGIVALQTAAERLLLDHCHAYQLAKAIHELNSPRVSVNLDRLQTNMVILHFGTPDFTAGKFESRLKESSVKEIKELGREVIVKVHPWCSTQVRCVFHSDVPEADFCYALKKILYVVKEADNNRQSESNLSGKNVNIPDCAKKRDNCTDEQKKIDTFKTPMEDYLAFLADRAARREEHPSHGTASLENWPCK